MLLIRWNGGNCCCSHQCCFLAALWKRSFWMHSGLVYSTFHKCHISFLVILAVVERGAFKYFDRSSLLRSEVQQASPACFLNCLHCLGIRLIQIDTYQVRSDCFPGSPGWRLRSLAVLESHPVQLALKKIRRKSTEQEVCFTRNSNRLTP